MKTLNSIAVLFVLIVLHQAGNAYAENLCEKKMSGYLVGYFNGIRNTMLDAKYTKRHLAQGVLSYSYNNEEVAYDVFYNTTRGYWDDIAEMYDMRAQEDKVYWEGFWARTATNNENSREMANAFVQEKLKAQASAYERLLTNSDSLSDLAVHRVQMEKYVAQGKKLLLVAHSAGNLFANAAYDVGVAYSHRLFKESYDVNKRGEASNIKIINVAPASKRVRGPYLLGDTDWAISFVRGETLPANMYLPSAYNKLWTGCYQTELTGHSMVGTYLNSNLLYGCYRPGKYDLPYSRFRSLAYSALASMRTPRSVLSEGFFEVALKWDGPEDLDLEVEEPSGNKVYYGAKTGRSGNLDMDARSGPAMEHYYGLCDSARILGDYKIYVNLHSTRLKKSELGHVRVVIDAIDGRFYYSSPLLDASLQNSGDRVHVVDIRVERVGSRYIVKEL